MVPRLYKYYKKLSVHVHEADHGHAYIKEWQVCAIILMPLANFQGGETQVGKAEMLKMPI